MTYYELNVPASATESGGEDDLLERFLDFAEDQDLFDARKRSKVKAATGIEVYEAIPQDDGSMLATVSVYWL